MNQNQNRTTIMAPTAMGINTAKTVAGPTWASAGAASSALVELLSGSTAYPDRPRTVSLVETHISWVFLTDRFVYKLKKPVRFDFLDFSTAEARRRACQAECDLNERLAPGVYLGVLPINCDERERLALNGRGRAVDWVVKMRRLPSDRMLDLLIREGRLSSSEAERLTTCLAAHYHRLSPVCVGAGVYGQAIERRVRDNRRELLEPRHGLPSATVKRCHAGQLQFIALEHAQFDSRVCDGRIVDGHGDLRPEHICLEADPVVFDCIEFSEELRRIDVADELGFFAMECDFLGATSLGQQVASAYRQVSGDHFSLELWNFYKCYRACVRAKVAALAALQTATPYDATSQSRGLGYLRLADAYASQLARPTVIVVCGLMGSGKSTLTAALAERLGSDVLSTDVIRSELLGASSLPAEFNAGHYAPEMRQHIYNEMLHRAKLLLRERVSLVLDGSFLVESQRHAAVALAFAAGATPLVVHCVCPAAEAVDRIEQRIAVGAGVSEARPELYEAQRAEEEPMSGMEWIEVDTTATLRLQESAVLSALRRRLTEGAKRS
jgi:aminoglycoside phosphotransferase family enzyme/predicted kinase